MTVVNQVAAISARRTYTYQLAAVTAYQAANTREVAAITALETTPARVVSAIGATHARISFALVATFTVAACYTAIAFVARIVRQAFVATNTI